MTHGGVHEWWVSFWLHHKRILDKCSCGQSRTLYSRASQNVKNLIWTSPYEKTYEFFCHTTSSALNCFFFSYRFFFFFLMVPPTPCLLFLQDHSHIITFTTKFSFFFFFLVSNFLFFIGMKLINNFFFFKEKITWHSILAVGSL